MNIKLKHIDTKKQQLSIPTTKTGRPRDIPLSEKAFEAVVKRIIFIRHGHAVIETKGDNITYLDNFVTRPEMKDDSLFSYSPDSISRAYSRACKRQGIENLTFHDLRHEATSRLFEYGLDIMEVSHITGHKDLKMLKRYTHLKPSNIADKINANRDKISN